MFAEENAVGLVGFFKEVSGFWECQGMEGALLLGDFPAGFPGFALYLRFFSFCFNISVPFSSSLKSPNVPDAPMLFPCP